jgi:hypothetical protein
VTCIKPRGLPGEDIAEYSDGAFSAILRAKS